MRIVPKAALFAIIGAFLGLCLPAASAKDKDKDGEGLLGPNVKKVTDSLNQALRASDDTTRAASLNAAVQEMQKALQSSPNHDLKAKVLALVQAAVNDQQNHNTTKVTADIHQALAGIHNGDSAIPSSSPAPASSLGNSDAAPPGITVSVSSVPPIVLQMIRANSLGKKIVEISRSDEDGEVSYDVETTTTDGDEMDLTVGEDGTLLSIDTTLADVPTPVQAAIQAQMGTGTLDEVEKLFDGPNVSYRAGITATNDILRDYTYNADGTLASVEANLNELSPAAQAAIQTEMGSGKVESIDKTLEDRKVTYDVTSTTAAGEEHSFSVSEKGELLSRQVTLNEAPAAAQWTISRAIGDGKILEIDQTLSDPNKPYSIEAQKQGKPFDFGVSPAGEFLGEAN